MLADEIRQHIVRGRFKVKKGGVFWWRPHIRGSVQAGRVVRTGYSVSKAPQRALV